MSYYTTNIRTLCDVFGRSEVESWFSSYNLADYLLPSQISDIEKAGLFTKEKLAKKIVDHFYMREIGLETPGLFRLRAIEKMEEIMEQYLPIIYTQAQEYNIFDDVNYTETYKMKGNDTSSGSGTGLNTSSSNSTNDSTSILNDTPQGKNKIQDTKNGLYASQININEGSINDRTTQETQSSSNQNINRTEEYEKHVEGNSGISTTSQRMILEFRKTIVAVTSEICEKLESLFMGLYF